MGRMTVGTGIAAGCVLAAAADGAYVGLSVEQLAEAITIDAATWDVYRVYANTTSPTDAVEAISGNRRQPIIIETDGVAFYQNKTFGVSDVEPMPGNVDMDPDLAFDTFVTIGAAVMDPVFGSTSTQGLDSPGFLPNRLSVTNGAWFRIPGNPLTLAGDDLRVLIGQFTVPSGAALSGVVRVTGHFDGIGGTFVGQTFGLPTPGTLAVLVVATAGCRRSRRR